jgi:hypothetical protein
MTVDDLSAALTAAFQNGFRDFLVGTMVAILPLLWVAALVFYLMRPYAIRTLRKLSLRLGADIFWLSYVLLRDGVLILTVVVGLVFFYPNILHDNAIPITAPLATVFALWVLLLKMVRDPDENPSDYRLTAVLLTIGSALYLVPLTLGVEVESQSHLESLSHHLVSNTNFDLALGVFYVSIALVAVTGAFIFGYVVRTSAPKPEPPARPAALGSGAGAPSSAAD